MTLYRRYVNNSDTFQVVIWKGKEKVVSPNDSIEIELDSSFQDLVEIRSYDFITSLIVDRFPLDHLLI